jgi:hypothetical protein
LVEGEAERRGAGCNATAETKGRNRTESIVGQQSVAQCDRVVQTKGASV